MAELQQSSTQPGHAGADKSRAVFISHSSKDANLAHRLARSLESLGIHCWIAPESLPLGASYADQCRQGIVDSGALVLMASEKALASVQVLSELEQAHKRSKPILTILIPPAKIAGEADFYLSRLHWMLLEEQTTDELAQLIAAVLSQTRAWSQTASPPSLLRTIRFRPRAFLRLVAAVALVAVLVIGGTLFALNRALNLDFRRLGYIDLAATASEAPSGGFTGHATVWLLAPSVHFQDVRLTVSPDPTSDSAKSHDYTHWPSPEQVGSMQPLSFPIQPGVTRLVTCLIVPSAAFGHPYRITQRFVVSSASSDTLVSEVAEKQVSRDNSSPCGSAIHR